MKRINVDSQVRGQNSAKRWVFGFRIFARGKRLRRVYR